MERTKEFLANKKLTLILRFSNLWEFLFMKAQNLIKLEINGRN